MLHLTERHLNSELTIRLCAFPRLRGDQAIADVDHRFDLQSEIGELHPQAIDVNVKTLGIERLVTAPD